MTSLRSYIVFGIVSAGLTITSVSATIVAVALPKMLADLDTSLTWVGWTLTGYQLGQSIVMPLAGKLSDDWGARRVFSVSMIVFTASTILAGFAPNVYVLIFARILQAVAAGAQLPSATSIVSDAFGERRATAIGLFTSIFPLGGVLGPTVGGVVIDHFSWRWMFYGSAPIGAALYLVGLAFIPPSKSLSQGKGLDLIGVGLFSGSMVAILSAMTAWGNDVQSIENPLTWLLVVAGAVALGIFLWHEGRTPSPVIELELLTSRSLVAANLYNFLYGLVLSTVSSFIPYYAAVVYGMSAGESGAVLAPRSAAMAIASIVSSVFLMRWGYRMPMVLGFVLNSVSMLMVSRGFHDLSLLGLQVPNLVLLSSMVMMAGFGHGIQAPPSNNASLDLVPGKLAAAVGLRGTFRTTGALLGTAAIVLAASRFGEQQASGMQTIILALALLGLLAVPLALLIPDSAHERYVAARRERRRAAGPPARD
ncbi:MAG: MFS transporter [Chloroflexi bacterium]|nr:MFS transporter [Chloroflexota bacterium]